MESATAGAIAGVLAMALTYPLDQVRTRLQAGDSAAVICADFRESGGSSLFRGMRGVLETVAVSNYVYFFFIDKLRDRKFVAACGVDFQNLTISTVSGICNVLLTEPLWKANTRLKLHAGGPSRSVFLETLQAVSAEGLSVQWRGVPASLLLVTNPVIQFFVYEHLKRRLLRSRKFLSAREAFLIGAVAKAVATFATYPLQVAQTRQRARPPAERGNVWKLLLHISRKEGFQGLFKGVGTKLTQTVLTAAFMFLFYERIRSHVASRLSF